MKIQVHLARLGAGLLGLMMLFAFASISYAQNYGAVVGTVLDTSGSVVPGSAVTLVNQGTNEKRSMKSDAAGNYRFVNLIPAVYRIDVESAGFKHMTREGITVQVGSEVRIDAALEVGAATETVTVESSTPLLQTESGTQSSVIEGKIVQEMPLNGRNTINLIALSPGVVPQGGTMGAAGMNKGNRTDEVGWGNYQIGGSIAGQSAMYIDGGPINVLNANIIALVPTQDAVQEFRVATNAVSSEYGRFAGGVVELGTKSGSNAWHGSAYEYLRNTLLNANDFISNSKAVKRQPFHQNQYGILASGPIKKDKAFFLFSWEDFKLVMNSPYQANVPTANQNAGKFYGKTLTASKAPAGCITNGNIDAGGTYAQIDPLCFDPTAVYMRQYYPAPNTSGSLNYFFSPSTRSTTHQYNARVDYSLSDRQHLFARYTYWKIDDQNPSVLGNYNGFATGQASHHDFTHQAVLGDSYILNPTSVLDVRLSYLRTYMSNISPSMGKPDMSKYGAAYAAMAPNMTFTQNVIPAFSGTIGLPGLNNTVPIAMDYMNNLALNANMTKTLGRHALKFGGEIRYMDHSGFGTNKNAASVPTFNSSTLGDEYASFLLGNFLSDMIQTNLVTNTFNYSQGYFVNDVWQATRNLTINAGVRWELPGGLAEKKDRTTVLLPDMIDPVIGKKGAVVLVNSDSYRSRSMEPVKHNLFSPRVSFALRLGGSTSLRGGYGVNFLSPDLPFGVMAYVSPVASAQTTNNVGGHHALSDPFGVLTGGSFLQPAGRTNPSFASKLVDQVVRGTVPSSSYPYLQQWNLDISRQLKGNLLLSLSYTGAKGTHLVASGAYDANDYTVMGLNQLPVSFYDTLKSMKATGSNDAQIRAYGQANRPFPQFKNYVNNASYSGATIYHAMNAKIEKRFHNGGLLSANYTWSKMIGDTDSTHWGPDGGAWGFVQNFYDMKAERSLSSYNIPHRVIVVYVLNLPFGKGQKFLNSGKVLTSIVSGWSMNGMANFQSGRQLGIYYNSNYLSNYFGAGTIRPNVVPGCTKPTAGKPSDRLTAWFNTACFTAPGDFAFGNESRVDSQLRTQGMNNYDLALQRVVNFKDKASLQFRFESFNLNNTPVFGAPGITMGGSNYGKVTTQANAPRLNQVSMRVSF